MLENYWEDARNNIFQAEEKYSVARLMFSACSFCIIMLVFLIIKRNKNAISNISSYLNEYKLLTYWKIDTWQ